MHSDVITHELVRAAEFVKSDMLMRHGLLAAAAASCVTAFSPHVYPAASTSAARLCAVSDDRQLAHPLSTRRTVLARSFFVSAGLFSARLWPTYPSLAADSEEDDDDEEEEEEVEVVKPKVRHVSCRPCVFAMMSTT
jgi:hypothetical protein